MAWVLVSTHAVTSNAAMMAMATHAVCVQQGRFAMRGPVRVVSLLAPIKNAAQMDVAATAALVLMINPHAPMRDFVWPRRAFPIVHRRSVAMMVVKALVGLALNMKVVRKVFVKVSACPIVR